VGSGVEAKQNPLRKMGRGEVSQMPFQLKLGRRIEPSSLFSRDPTILFSEAQGDHRDVI